MKLLKILTCVCFAVFYTFNLHSQEIDRLYNIYKNKDSINLVTPHGNLLGYVIINKNDEDKPESVRISGFSHNKSAVVSHLANTIKMKIKQGYRPIENYITGYGSYSSLMEIQMMTFNLNGDYSFEMAFTKGNMSFRATVSLNFSFRKSGFSYFGDEKYEDGYRWDIETIDSKRVAGKGGHDFIF